MVITLFEASAIGLVVAGFGIATVLFYRFSNLRIMKKINELKKRQDESHKSLSRVLDTRQGEVRELKKRIESIEDKLDLLLSSKGEAREVAAEKIRARSK